MSNELEFLKTRIRELEIENNLLKEQHIEIKQAKELYLKIFDEFPALIWRARLDKLCDYFNKTWLDFTGRTMEQEFGNGWAEMVHPDDFDFCLKTYVEAFDKHESFLMEYRMKNKFGEYRWIRDFGRPFYDLDNTFLGYIGSCYDITESKNNELQLIELNAAKNKFFSIIAHDLRNPFNNILGLTELINKNHTIYNADKMELLTSRLFLSVKYTHNLLENLLEWAKVQFNKTTFDPKTINFIEVCNDVVDVVISEARLKKITVNVLEDSDITLSADENMFKTILRNLITNAIKFTNEFGEVNVSAEVAENIVTITVSDTGVGIQPDKLKNLFDLSYKNSTKGTSQEIGTGLGLFICKEFVEQHGGVIWAESEECKGSKFKFTLPQKHNID